jgi:hypothetical protein
MQSISRMLPPSSCCVVLLLLPMVAVAVPVRSGGLGLGESDLAQCVLNPPLAFYNEFAADKKVEGYALFSSLDRQLSVLIRRILSMNLPLYSFRVNM